MYTSSFRRAVAAGFLGRFQCALTGISGNQQLPEVKIEKWIFFLHLEKTLSAT